MQQSLADIEVPCIVLVARVAADLRGRAWSSFSQTGPHE